MQRNTGYFPTESLEPSGNRLFSRSALNEGYLFRGSLDVCVGNVPAIRLYEQCGFACAGTAEMHFCVGTVDPCRLYEKTL